jgi:4-oxalocrotonate tautomerase
MCVFAGRQSVTGEFSSRSSPFRGRAELESEHSDDGEKGRAMPDIRVTMLTGVDKEQIAALGSALTDAVVSTLGIPGERVRVTVAEYEPEHWFVGGSSLAQLGFTNQR